VLIAFEGGEGAGKSSQIELLAEAVRATGRTVVVTHEPGGSVLGRQLRRLLLDSDEPIAPRAEALLFAADRAQHVAGVIRPALERGEVVLTHRFVDSSLAYQGAGRMLAVEEVGRLSRWATEELLPDLTVLLDVPVEIGLARVRQRQAAVQAGTAAAHAVPGLDRLERETLDFHERVRAGFRSLAGSDPGRYLVLDASRALDDLAATISAGVRELLTGSHEVAEAPK
jgi:dTMP kinase